MEKELNDLWGEIKDAWNSSSETTKIEMQISGLVAELNSKISRFEKESIKNDMNTIRASVNKFENGVSQFEKDSIKRDLTIINNSIKKIISYFKKKKE